MSFFSLLAQYQSISRDVRFQGQFEHIIKDPYYICNGIPVYHVSINDLDPAYLQATNKRLHKWGSFYNPDMLLGMGCAGGKNKIYIDSSDKDFYYLYIYTKLDEEIMGKSSYAGSVVAWTPKTKGDNIVKVGFRLFYTAARCIDNLNSDEPFLEDENYDGTWWEENDWNCSPRCLAAFACIRPTKYKDQEMYQKILKISPNWMKPLLAQTRVK